MNSIKTTNLFDGLLVVDRVDDTNHICLGEKSPVFSAELSRSLKVNINTQEQTLEIS